MPKLQQPQIIFLLSHMNYSIYPYLRPVSHSLAGR